MSLDLEGTLDAARRETPASVREPSGLSLMTQATLSIQQPWPLEASTVRWRWTARSPALLRPLAIQLLGAQSNASANQTVSRALPKPRNVPQRVRIANARVMSSMGTPEMENLSRSLGANERPTPTP